MLGWLLLVFAGLSLSTVLDSNGSDDNQDDRANDNSGDAGQTSNTRILTLLHSQYLRLYLFFQ